MGWLLPLLELASLRSFHFTQFPRGSFSCLKPLLLNQVRAAAIRVHRYSIITGEAYANIIRRFIIFQHKRHLNAY